MDPGRLATGSEVIAFEYATWLACALDQESPRRDDDPSVAFGTLVMGARERSRALIDGVNELRGVAGCERIRV
jgi:hypothetical protein